MTIRKLMMAAALVAAMQVSSTHAESAASVHNDATVPLNPYPFQGAKDVVHISIGPGNYF